LWFSTREWLPGIYGWLPFHSNSCIACLAMMFLGHEDFQPLPCATGTQAVRPTPPSGVVRRSGRTPTSQPLRGCWNPQPWSTNRRSTDGWQKSHGKAGTSEWCHLLTVETCFDQRAWKVDGRTFGHIWKDQNQNHNANNTHTHIIIYIYTLYI
jgi:hypothetical protein